MYLPGRGGNLRIGIRKGGTAKWLSEAANIVTRYRAAEMVNQIHDPLLGSGVLEMTVLAFDQTEGPVVRTLLSGTQESVDLIWAYGGASGERGSRDGAIGTEREPVTRFVLHGKPLDLAGVFRRVEASGGGCAGMA